MDSQALKIVYRYGLIVLVAISVFSCKREVTKKLPYYNTPDFTPLWLQNGDKTDTLHVVAPFSFTDQEGKTINNASYKGTVYVANFFFTSCPGICPRMMKNMKKVADSFRYDERVKFLSHSVTPNIDSVPRLKKYAGRFDIDEGQWKLVTGNHDEIYTLARKSYFAEEEIGLNKDATEFLHTEHFILVDAHGHLRGIYNGTVDLEMQRLCEDIRLLLAEETLNTSTFSK